EPAGIGVLSLDDALPISGPASLVGAARRAHRRDARPRAIAGPIDADARSRHDRRACDRAVTRAARRANDDENLSPARRGSTERRSEEHTSELQSRENLVC